MGIEKPAQIQSPLSPAPSAIACAEDMQRSTPSASLSPFEALHAAAQVGIADLRTGRVQRFGSPANWTTLRRNRVRPMTQML